MQCGLNNDCFTTTYGLQNDFIKYLVVKVQSERSQNVVIILFNGA